MVVRHPAHQKSSICRLCISNDAGYLLTMHIYQEVTDPQTGVIKFVSLFPDRGPWHGLPVSTPYMTKDFLETKRSKAQALETTFVYDYPGMTQYCFIRTLRLERCSSISSYILCRHFQS